MFADVLEEFDTLRASAEVTPVNNAPVPTTPTETRVNPPVNTQHKSRGGVLLALIAVLVLSILIAQTLST